MTDALAVVGDGSDMLSALVSRRKMINNVMTNVMQKKIDYGTIPGCGDKPALFKPGAEKLCSVFGLAPEFIVEDLGGPDERRYRIRTRILSSEGKFLGEGVGECSSNEEKYKWKGARRVEFDAVTDESRKRIKFQKEGGKEIQILQIRTNPADVANTVLKMSKKRSLIDGVLTVTATSDLLTQDIEEFAAINDVVIVEGGLISTLIEDKVPANPAPAAEKPPAADTRYVTIVEDAAKVYKVEGKPDKNYRVYVVKEGKKEYECSCWDSSVAKIVTGAMDAGLRCAITVLTSKEGKVKIVAAKAEDGVYQMKGAADEVADAMQKGG